MRTALLFALIGALGAGCRGMHPPPADGRPIVRTMTVTGYCQCGKCCGWRRTWYGSPVYAYGLLEGRRKVVGMTASGTMAKPGTIAADTSRYPFGTVMYVKGYGYGRVEDRGSDIQGDRIDLYFRTHRQAQAWGRKTLPVTIWTAD